MNDDPDRTPQESQEVHAADAVAVVAPMPLPVPAGPRNIWRKWLNVTTRPSVASFARELLTANWYDTLLSLAGLGFLSAILQYFSKYTTAQILGFSHWNAEIAGVPIPRSVASASFMVGQPLAYFLVVGLLFVVAKVLGGKSTFLEQVYAMTLSYVPLFAIIDVVRYVPAVGNITDTVLTLYSFVLLVLAIAASQRLTIGRATFVVVSPILAFFVVLIVALILVFAIGIVGVLISALFSHLR